MESKEDLLAYLKQYSIPFARLLGIKVLSAASDRLVASMLVREDMCTIPAILHGGAMIALADTVGAMATVVNLRDNAATTTIESKTNFFAPASVGTTITAECTPLHRGRRTMVWQTRIMSAEGRLLALVTQTQLVLEARPAAT